MTKEEFIRQYAHNSGVSVKWLIDHQLEAVPCLCEYHMCQGWQMKTKSNVGKLEDNNP